jgi:L-lactate dehydrogenase complex protein LldG
VSDAREAILRAVRAARPAAVALPPRAALRTVAAPIAARADRAAPADLAARFADAARAAGAEVVLAARTDVPRLAAALAPAGEPVVSRVRGVAATVALPTTPDTLAGVGLFVCEGSLGVAENGAVWLTGARLGQQAALFLAERVVVVLAREALVADMHAAYARLDVAAESFGAFVAGPSKTADIEQALVVGAHGPTALTVLLVDGADGGAAEDA